MLERFLACGREIRPAYCNECTTSEASVSGSHAINHGHALDARKGRSPLHEEYEGYPWRTCKCATTKPVVSLSTMKINFFHFANRAKSVEKRSVCRAGWIDASHGPCEHVLQSITIT